MDIYLKVIAGVLITAIISLVLSKQCQEIALLLTICVCCLVVIVLASYLQPILDFAQRLAQLGQLNEDFLSIILKIVGVGLISQIAGLICADAGNQTLSKILQIMTSVVILSISTPLLEEIISLVELVLGDL